MFFIRDIRVIRGENFLILRRSGCRFRRKFQRAAVS